MVNTIIPIIEWSLSMVFLLVEKKKEGNLFLSKLIKPNNDNSKRGIKCPVKFNGRCMVWLANVYDCEALAVCRLCPVITLLSVCINAVEIL